MAAQLGGNPRPEACYFLWYSREPISSWLVPRRSRLFLLGDKMDFSLINILELLGAFTALMTVIAALTPTKADDKVVTWLDRIGNLADRLGIRVKRESK